MRDLAAATAAPARPFVGGAPLDAAIARGTAALLGRQRDDGHWAFDLEADATIPAEYVVLRRFLGRPDRGLEARIGVHLRRLQRPDGWSLFHAGAPDISASVKAYLALKWIGDDPDAPHMQAARAAILALGGAERSNVFTRSLLALLGQIPWRAVPVMPPEIMLLPRWFPFHLSKISYWARTVLVPLLVVNSRRPRSDEPCPDLSELFATPPEQVKRWPGGGHEAEPWATLFRGLDAALQRTQHRFPASRRQKAEAAAMRFVDERLNGEDGLGGIYPAMANALIMYRCLGVPDSDPRVVTAWKAVDGLVIEREDEALVQPCLSPVWDTALAAHALLETRDPQAEAAAAQGLRWLLPRQVTEVVGDWAVTRPGLRPGGWAFQYNNPHYPDLDDTAAVVLALDRARDRADAGDPAAIEAAIDRATEWVAGMQSRDGGWAAFDADNTAHHLNSIPFADHGALLDPPTADVTARCLGMLAQLGRLPANDRVARRGLRALLAMQEPDGSWFGRWGINYVYGTWSALSALNAVGTPHAAPPVRRAAEWLKANQNADGGWGEDGASYALNPADRPEAPSSASQTAWALLGLMAAGEAHDPAVDRGLEWLMAHQAPEGGWEEEAYTGTGFPRVFYLRYLGYAQIFPLWALARARELRRGNAGRVPHGL
ncbi:squalene--hopene cyclase [Roseomonas sp. BN140053]|uniref:squalene--hopene cyclase n=1 Tax=Roseomonas sp. BN140053 TaxID=3391898 RepID=UPI0039ED02D3